MALSAEETRLLADARGDLPGSIPDGVAAAYFAMLRDFLDFTNVWQEDINISILANTVSYVLTPPAIGRINRLLLLADSAELVPRSRWISNAQMIIPGTIIIATRPSTTATWVATVAKTILDPINSDGNPVIDQWILQKYWDTLFAGILSRMMASPNKTYTNPTMSVFYGKKFLSGKTIARNEAIKGNVRGQTNWAYPQSYHSSQRGA